jgi:hypothetical protein
MSNVKLLFRGNFGSSDCLSDWLKCQIIVTVVLQSLLHLHLHHQMYVPVVLQSLLWTSTRLPTQSRQMTTSTRAGCTSRNTMCHGPAPRWRWTPRPKGMLQGSGPDTGIHYLSNIGGAAPPGPIGSGRMMRSGANSRIQYLAHIGGGALTRPTGSGRRGQPGLSSGNQCQSGAGGIVKGIGFFQTMVYMSESYVASAIPW